jgi:hypothetical protein
MAAQGANLNMPLYSLTERDLRDHCKRAIEALETWMRRLIHQQLSDAYGANYIDAMRPSGQRVINNDIARGLRARMTSDPERFPTPIDATFLEDAIALLCNPELYTQHFQAALMKAFPEGQAEARTFLNRLVRPRNALYHANPISVHEAYRVLCYTHDIIQSVKAYYESVNMQQQFNVPQVIRVIDSLGHAVSFSPASRPDGFGMLDYSRDENAILHCGDTLSIEVEVDPTFDPSTYEVEWLIGNVGGPRTTGSRFVLPLEERYVSTRLCLVCRVTSNAAWHKLGTHDDQLDIAYRVLPPTIA